MTGETSRADKPYVILSCAVSVDGYIDDTSDERLLLSNEADFDRVDEVRAGVDAILIGANTLRSDNPRLFIRSMERRARRVSKGLPELPYKVTLTRSGNLDPDGKFFTAGDVEKLVYCPEPMVAAIRDRLSAVATVVGVGEPPSLTALLTDLKARGVNRLMVEGGGEIHTQFLEQGLADELHYAVAPFFVGDSGAPRFVNPGELPRHRMHVENVERIGDVVLITYLTRHNGVGNG